MKNTVVIFALGSFLAFEAGYAQNLEVPQYVSPVAVAGEIVSFQVPVRGGVPPYTFSIDRVVGGWPVKESLSSSGLLILDGTHVVNGDYCCSSMYIDVVDSVGARVAHVVRYGGVQRPALKGTEFDYVSLGRFYSATVYKAIALAGVKSEVVVSRGRLPEGFSQSDSTIYGTIPRPLMYDFDLTATLFVNGVSYSSTATYRRYVGAAGDVKSVPLMSWYSIALLVLLMTVVVLRCAYQQGLGRNHWAKSE